MKNTETPHKDVAKKIKQSLDQQPLDQQTQQALNQARMSALQPQTQSSLFSRYAKPTLAFASLAAIAIVITLTIQHQTEEFNIDNIEAFEILSHNDDLELYENLEFYVWLDGELKG